ncbi:MAG TPA: phosphatase PAP2 family protein [Planctomycetota bacterium]|nr:phosphatase PAP2 family protein [Planctomycetota bacterium]
MLASSTQLVGRDINQLDVRSRSASRVIRAGVALFLISFVVMWIEGALLGREALGALRVQPGSPSFVAARIISELGEGWAIAVFVLLAVALLRDPRLPQDFVLGYAGTSIVLHTLKVLVARARPDLSNFDAWPSGHAMAAGLFAVLVALRLPRRVGGTLVAAACLIAASRVALGRHYVSDVLAGLGLACVGAGLLGFVPDLSWSRTFANRTKLGITYLAALVFALDIAFGRAVERHPGHLLLAPAIVFAIAHLEAANSRARRQRHEEPSS